MKKYKLELELYFPEGLDEEWVSKRFSQVLDLVEESVVADHDADSERLSGKATDELIDLINELRS